MEAELSPAIVQALKGGLDQVLSAATQRSQEALGAALTALQKRQGEANKAAFGPLWSRLRKQAGAALGGGDEARFEALIRATRQVAAAAGQALGAEDFFASVGAEPVGVEPVGPGPGPSETGIEPTPEGTAAMADAAFWPAGA